jgi:hypothetical protein
MIRKLSLLAALATSACIAQTQPASSNQGMVQGGQQLPIVVPANIYVVSSFYGTGVYVVPSGGLLPPAGTAGISVANQAGISATTPIDTGLQSTLGPRPITYGSPSSFGPGYSVYGPGYGAYGAGTVPQGYPAEATLETQGRLIDMGPSYFAGGAKPAGSAVSLAETAAKSKTTQARSVRTFTNADAERMTNKITIRRTTINEQPVAPAPRATPPPPK